MQPWHWNWIYVKGCDIVFGECRSLPASGHTGGCCYEGIWQILEWWHRYEMPSTDIPSRRISKRGVNTGRRFLINQKWMASLSLRCAEQINCLLLVGSEGCCSAQGCRLRRLQLCWWRWQSPIHTRTHTHTLAERCIWLIYPCFQENTGTEECGRGGHYFIKLKRDAAAPKTRHKQFKLNKQTRVIGPRLLHCRQRRYELTPKYLHPIFSGARWMDGYGFAGAGWRGLTNEKWRRMRRPMQ